MTHHDQHRLPDTREIVLGVALFLAGIALATTAAWRLPHTDQIAQAPAPETASPPTPSAPAMDKPAPAEPGGTRPTTPAPTPARPDADAQKAGAQPALPPAPAEKSAPPIPAR
jgi:hypothetical protein